MCRCSLNTCTVFDPQLGVRGCRGPALRTDLCRFYIQDSSICVFRCLGPLEPTPLRYQGTTAAKFLGSQKLCEAVRLHGESVPLTPASSKGQP